MSEPQNPQPAPTPEPTPAPAPESANTAPPPPPPSQGPSINYADFGTSAGAGGVAVPKDSSDRTMGMLCHLLAFSGHLIPFGHVLGPLVIWLIKKDESPFVDDQGKESLNFQITMTIAFVVSIILVFVIIGAFLAMLVWLADVILVIVATVKASQGIAYRYPFCLRLIK